MTRLASTAAVKTTPFRVRPTCSGQSIGVTLTLGCALAWSAGAAGARALTVPPAGALVAEGAVGVFSDADRLDTLLRELAADETPIERRLELQADVRELFRALPRAAMGVQYSNAQVDRGVPIQALTEGFPSARILRPGDVIVAIDGQTLGQLDLVKRLAAELSGVSGIGLTGGVPIGTAAMLHFRCAILSRDPGAVIRVQVERPIAPAGPAGDAPGVNPAAPADGAAPTATQTLEFDVPLGSFADLGSTVTNDQAVLDAALAVRALRVVGRLPAGMRRHTVQPVESPLSPVTGSLAMDNEGTGWLNINYALAVRAGSGSGSVLANVAGVQTPVLRRRIDLSAERGLAQLSGSPLTREELQVARGEVARRVEHLLNQLRTLERSATIQLAPLFETGAGVRPARRADAMFAGWQAEAVRMLMEHERRRAALDELNARVPGTGARADQPGADPAGADEAVIVPIDPTR